MCISCRALQSEYDELKQAHAEDVQRCSFNSDVIADGNQNGNGGDAEMLAEARLLRQHKDRLESRMKTLEEHNEQLDTQLKRLRQMLNSNDGVRLTPALYMAVFAIVKLLIKSPQFLT